MIFSDCMPKFKLCVRIYVCKYVYLCVFMYLCIYVCMYDVHHYIQIPCTRYVAINRLYLYHYVRWVSVHLRAMMTLSHLHHTFKQDS